MQRLAFIFALLFSVAGFCRESVRPFGGGRSAVIFAGPTICKGCFEPWQDLLEQEGFVVTTVGPGETTAGLLSKTSLYLVPGGEDVQNLADGWSSDEREAIRKYILNGGRYLGVCLGAYWVADWLGETPGFESLGLAPAHVWAHGKDKSDQVVRVKWRGQTRLVYFQDGPAFSMKPGADTDSVYATYDDGSIAAFVTTVGRGRVAASGVHVEADEAWFIDAKLPSPGLATDLALELLHALY